MNRLRALLELLEDRHLLANDLEFVADLNLTPHDPDQIHGASPAIVDIGEQTFLFSHEIQHRSHSFARPELWVIENDEATLLHTFDSEFYPSRCCKTLSVQEYSGRLVFFVDHLIRGTIQRELWISDGTPNGTHALAQFPRNEQGDDLFKIIESDGDSLYFKHNQTLWKSDFTPEATLAIYDASSYESPFGFASGLESVYVDNGDLYLTNDRSLLRIDETGADPSLVFPYVSSSFVDPLLGNLYVESTTDTWHVLQEGIFQRADSVVDQLLIDRRGPGDAIQVGGQLVAIRNERELWSTDGETVKQILIEGDFQSISSLRQVADQVSFVVYPERQQWITDGTIAQELDVSSSLTPVATIGETSIFWQGASLMAINADLSIETLRTFDSASANFSEGTEDVYFRADDGAGLAVWRTDGTIEGTEAVFRRYGEWTEGSQFGDLLSQEGNLFLETADRNEPFQSDGAVRRFWVSDGTETTSLGIPANARVVARFDSFVFFVDTHEGNERLWALDGREASSPTVIFTRAISSKDLELHIVGSRLAVVTDRASGSFLFYDPSDATIATLETGLHVVSVEATEASTNQLLIVAASEAGGFDIWLTDGTDTRTQRLVGSDAWKGGLPRNLQIAGDTIYFLLRRAFDTTEVWFSRQDETGQLAALDMPLDSESATYLVGDWLVVLRKDREDAVLWMGDASGSVRTWHGDFQDPLTFDGGLAVYERDSNQTWIIRDEATITVQKIHGQVGFAHEGYFYYTRSTPSGLDIYSDAFNQTLYRTDGTSSGTQVVADLSAESVELQAMLGVVGEFLYFAGTDLVHGSELWRVSLTPHQVGDVNFDGSVDFQDFLVLSRSFGREFDVAYADGDLDADGRVSFADFLLLSANFRSK